MGRSTHLGASTERSIILWAIEQATTIACTSQGRDVTTQHVETTARDLIALTAKLYREQKTSSSTS